jgi:hypothetical protein
MTFAAIDSAAGFSDYKLFKGNSFDYMVNPSGKGVIPFDKRGEYIASWTADGNGTETRYAPWDMASTYTLENSTITINLDQHFYLIYNGYGDFVRGCGADAGKNPVWKLDILYMKHQVSSDIFRALMRSCLLAVYLLDAGACLPCPLCPLCPPRTPCNRKI